MQHILAAALCLFSLAVQGQAFSWGRCQQLPVVQDFNVPEYMNKWYEQAGYNTEATRYNLRCVNTVYQLNSSTNVITVQNRGIRNEDNKHQGINGTAVLADPSKDEGRLIVTFHPFWWFTVKGDYWVLGTDYCNYAVVYSCQDFLFFHYYTIWYLSREQTLSSSTDFFNSADQILIDNGLDPSIIQSSSQYNCDV
ncbi:apolipoprotein D-like [Homalodisca vitripennis]|uniref:apolipoprotein D-like n=1 Tax=Homalodisca vitripennis TaxID=197043 RepID=UPI001EEC31E7|nr:apolipoprotein D-like [Homalodisca vitripennis]KAG8337830.1 hypothetical protein J6590_015501 [Homalodisca vitripennis]